VAAFYFDENVSAILEEPLRSYGHLVFSTYAEGRLRSPDPHQLLYATEREWVVVTHNRDDFALLHDAWHLWTHRWHIRDQHAGIVVVEQTQGVTYPEYAAMIHDLTTQTVTFANVLFDWRLATGWVRNPRS